MTDLDGCSHSWRTDRSTRPDAYTLLSAPGVQDNGDAVVPSIACPRGCSDQVSRSFCEVCLVGCG
jgi:hypothetical protein